MTVCKFFQQGYCRYGQNCRFDHIYGSKYSYHANHVSQAPAPQPQANNGVTDENLVRQVQTDVQAILHGNQWLLSSYAPFKEKPAFPGLADLSPEEARLFIYEAKANNTLDQAVLYINNLFKESRQMHEQLLHPNSNITKILRSLYNGETVVSPFNANTAQTSSFGNNAASVFRSATQTTSVFHQNNSTAPSGFGQNTNNQPPIFGQNQTSSFGQPNAAKSIFAQAVNQTTHNVFNPAKTESTTASSMFAIANKTVFGQESASVFATSNQNAANLFASANQSSNNVFGPNVFGKTEAAVPQQNSSPFSQNAFHQSSTPSPFGGNVFQKANVEEPGVYSKVEDITEEDLTAFQSDSFKLGFVPEVAPPQSLCF